MGDLDALISENWDAAVKAGEVDKATTPLDPAAEVEAENSLLDAPVTVPDDEPDGEPGEGIPDDDAPAEGDDEPEADAAADDDADDDVGTEHNPYTAKDFDGQYLRTKVDGEVVTIPMTEALENVGRQAALDRRLSRAQKAIESSESAVEHANAQSQRFRQGVFNTLSDAEKLAGYLDSFHPEVLDQLAVAHYQNVYAQHEAGTLKQWQAERKLRNRQRQLEARERQLQQQSQQTRKQETTRHLASVAGPAIREAIAETGFGNVTRELLQDIGVFCDGMEAKKGAPLTADEVKAYAIRLIRAEANGQPTKRKPRVKRRAPKASQGPQGAKKARPGASNGTIKKFGPDGKITAAWLLSQHG